MRFAHWKSAAHLQRLAFNVIHERATKTLSARLRTRCYPIQIESAFRHRNRTRAGIGRYFRPAILRGNHVVVRLFFVGEADAHQPQSAIDFCLIEITSRHDQICCGGAVGVRHRSNRNSWVVVRMHKQQQPPSLRVPRPLHLSAEPFRNRNTPQHARPWQILRWAIYRDSD